MTTENNDLRHEGQCIAYVGWLDQGLDFFGPFPDSDAAEKWIKEEVSPALPAGWGYLDPAEPSGEADEICMSCGGEGICDCVVTITEVGHATMKAKEKVVGIQTAIPGTVPDEILQSGPLEVSVKAS
jgi:hypothetical protein